MGVWLIVVGLVMLVVLYVVPVFSRCGQFVCLFVICAVVGCGMWIFWRERCFLLWGVLLFGSDALGCELCFLLRVCGL